MNNKQLLFKLTKDNFKVEYFCAGGHGGQNMQKNATACRITHPESKATGISRDERFQLQNRKLAFKRLINSPEFQKWHRIQCSKALGTYIDIESWVEEQMNPKNLKFEIQIDGKWSIIEYEDLLNLEDLNYDDLEE